MKGAFFGDATARPAPVQQSPLPAWDASNPDGSGIVHTTPPSELQIPPPGDPSFMRGDFNGVTLDAGQWPDSYFQGLNIRGANSTPYQMLMSPMLILYPRVVQDAYLTAAAERGYWDITTAPDGWNLAENGYPMSEARYVAWNQYLQSWGFRVNGWRLTPTPDDTYLRACLNAGAVNFWCCGKEVDTQMPAEQYEAVLQNNVDMAAGAIRVGAHFTDNWPSGFPRDTFLTNWAPYDGKVDLCWQANQDDTAGTQGGRLYYARLRVYKGLQGDGVYHPEFAAPHSRIILWEMEATDELYGRDTEAYGCLRTLEALYCPSDDPAIPMLFGFNNGCRLPDGSAL